ncbi:MAG: MFS transporter [Phycisphaerales bacterium]|nr:MFS transporter [Phycisphaerales bacterium]
MTERATPSTLDESTHHAREPLPRTVIVLGWVSFFADVSSEMVYPVLPMFIVGVLGASATGLGWVEGVASAVIAALAAWAGWRSDRKRRGVPRRTPFVRAGYALPVAGKAIIALASAWPIAMLGRGVDRLGKGMRGSPRDALIADATHAEQRGRAFGFHRMMDTAGATVGVLIAALALWVLGVGRESTPSSESALTLRLLIGAAAAVGLASAALTFLVRDRKPETQEPADAAAAPDVMTNGAVGLPRSYWLTVMMLVVFALGNSSDAFLLLRAGEAGFSPVEVTLAYALCNVVYALVSYPAGVMSDRVGRWRFIFIGWIVYALVYTGFVLVSGGAIWALMGVYGVYLALTDGVGKALISDHAPRDRRGRALGLFAMLQGVATLFASVAAGVLWDEFGSDAAFAFGAACSVVALVIAVGVRSSVRRAG